MSRCLAILILFAGTAAAAEISGTVVDPSGAAIAGAQVTAVNRVGVAARTGTDSAGRFSLEVADPAEVRLIVTAAGFATRGIAPAEANEIRLAIAPQVDSVSVVGSAIDVPLSEQGGSASVIPAEEIRQRNEPMAMDLLRYLPGMSLNQVGARGGLTGLYIRGGNPNFNLVQVDGMAVNTFGGSFDFAHIPSDQLERVEVIRGPQSAVYGPYAIGGVVNFVTRSAEESPAFDILAEGGSHSERRFALGGALLLGKFGIAGSASRLDSDGPVANSDYRNEGVSLHLTRSFTRQNLALSGMFNSNENGVPGPYGSDPAGLFPGLDTVSRNKNNFSTYRARYQIDLSPRVREELSGSVFWNNSYFTSGFGDLFNKDIRGLGETRTIVSVNRYYTIAVGAAFTREEIKNGLLTDDASNAFPLRRADDGLYWENRLQFGNRLFLNAGIRGEIIRTPRIPANSGYMRPEFPPDTITSANPKVSVAYALHGARLHGSFGTGIRPPGAFDLAFTNNPALKPERVTSLDAGIEYQFWNNRISVDGTYFNNRFRDLIISLGGSLAVLSSFSSDNLSNARAQGGEFSARVRPARWLSAGGWYTYLKSEILSLDGSSGMAPAYFRVGQELQRRPAHSGALVSTATWSRFTLNVTGYFRGTVLDVEPNWGAFAGLYRAPGYANIGVNLNCRVSRRFTVYGNLRNALNQHYEEAFGYPSPLLNFVTGMKWTLSR